MNSLRSWLPRDALVVLFLTALAVTVFFLLPRDRRHALMREDGLVQRASVMLLAASTGYCGWRGVRATTGGGDWWLAALVFAGLCLRELDCQKRFTDKSFDNIMFFKNPHIATQTKVIVVAAVLPFALALSRILWRALRQLRHARRNRLPWLAYAFWAVAMLGLSLQAEKWNWVHLEELGELSFAVLLLLLARFLPKETTNYERIQTH